MEIWRAAGRPCNTLRKYSRRMAAYPKASEGRPKYWPPVSRIDELAGDRNLICTCPPVSEYAS